MSKRKTGLAAFAQSEEKAQSEKAQATKNSPAKRRRGRGATVAMTVRLLRDDWERLHQLAVSEGVSFQHLAIRGFSAVLDEKGLPPI